MELFKRIFPNSFSRLVPNAEGTFYTRPSASPIAPSTAPSGTEGTSPSPISSSNCDIPTAPHGEYCSTRSEDGLLCTRERGHSGPHHAHGYAHGSPGECFEVWEGAIIADEDDHAPCFQRPPALVLDNPPTPRQRHIRTMIRNILRNL